MEGFLCRTEEDIADRNCCEQEDHLQTLEILHFHAIEIRLVHCELLQTLEECDGDIRFATLIFRFGCR